MGDRTPFGQTFLGVVLAGTLAGVLVWQITSARQAPPTAPVVQSVHQEASAVSYSSQPVTTSAQQSDQTATSQQTWAELRKQVKQEFEAAERKRLAQEAQEQEQRRKDAEASAEKERQEQLAREEARTKVQREAEVRAQQEQQLREQQYQAQLEEARLRALHAQQASAEEARKLEEQERAAQLERDVRAGRKRPDGSWMPGCGEGGCNTTWSAAPNNLPSDSERAICCNNGNCRCN